MFYFYLRLNPYFKKCFKNLLRNFAGLNLVAVLTSIIRILIGLQEKQWIQRYPTIGLIPTSIYPEIHVS
jgi:hypothetical protein